jgi:hypothetical protein
MPLPNLACVPVQKAVAPSITLPGGAQLVAMAGLDTGDLSAIVRGVLSMVNTALVPLTPIFNIIDTVIAIKDCIMAVPSVPINPQALVDAIEKLVESIAKLASIIPQVSVPLMVRDIINVIILALTALKTELSTLIVQSLRIDGSTQKAALPGNEALAAVLDCARAAQEATMENLGKSMEPLNRMINLINALLDIAQVPKDVRLPSLDDLGDDAEAALDVLDVAIDILTAISDLLPV